MIDSWWSHGTHLAPTRPEKPFPSLINGLLFPDQPAAGRAAVLKKMPVHHFSDFELDEELRQLRLRGREVTLQPRAFDVLAYLVNNRMRVVDKDELLENLWPGVIVTDGSLQRAVSLARAALRSGGLDDAIRTYAKRGYRFNVDLGPRAVDHAESGDPAAVTNDAKRLFERGVWGEAAEAFERADRISSLPPDELENWGIALQCAGAAAAAAEPFERAAEAYSAAGECQSAARAVMSLARIYFETGERAVAKGCLRRAATMLEGLPLCEQHGHLAWVSSWLASYDGNMSATLEHAQRTVDIARQLNNVDLEAMGLLFWGIALQASGDTQRGLELQDEAGAVVLTGSVTPLLGGIVYCGLIAGCCNTGDWPRAGQWSESFTRWCRRNGLRRFSGWCLLHRVEVFIARGELQKAAREIRESDEFFEMGGAGAVGDARRFLADVHFLHAEFDQAETAYRAAYEHGANPHPGFAMLLHRRGQSQAAIRALRRSAAETSWASGERKPLYLAHVVIIASQSGDLDAAHQALEKLRQQPDSWAMGTMRAHVLRAQGELHLAGDQPADAVRLFRDAMQLYQEMDAHLESAAVRLRLVECLVRLEDPDGASLELDSAESVFTRNDARLYLDDCRQLRLTIISPSRAG